MAGQNNKRRILTVDDNPDITFTIKLGLEASGLFEVDTFNDPELALSSFRPVYDQMKKIDDRLKVCFMTPTYQNY